jgi:cytochrome c heme-lyase
MFYNALVRKNKLEGVEVEDIETVVSIHNNMNENTWSQILAWEALNKKPNTPVELEPRLLRFTGRPDDLSPKAQLKMLFGHTKPFDRHDWIVDRGGKEVRYVIDYYHDESKVNDDKRPTHLNDVKSMKSIKVDVRPALDSISSFYDYFFRMPIKYTAGNAGAYDPPSFFPASQIKRAEDTRKIQISNIWAAVKKDCAGCKDTLASCSNETECQSASVALQLCMARIVCPDIANKFDTSVANFKKTKVMDESINESFSSVVKCLENFEIESKRDY